MRAPKRDTLHVDVRHQHDGKDHDQRERYGGGDHKAWTDTQTYETRGQDDRDCLPQRRHEFGNRAVDRRRLIGHQFRLYAERQIRRGLGKSRLDVLAQSQDVAALAHGNCQADGRLSVDAKQRLRRIGKAALYLRNVAQAQHASANSKIDVGNVFFGPKCPRDAK